MFTIVTDSTAYFTRKEAEALGIRVLPMSFQMAGREHTEGFLDENGRYLEMLTKAGKDSRTAHVAVGTYMSTFKELLRKNSDVLCVTMSSRLSGAYSSAVLAAKEIDPDRIVVVDSLSTAGGLKMLVLRACALSRENCAIRDAEASLLGLRDCVGIAFSVEDMEPLRRSGRLGFVRQSVGTILNLRPILYCKNGAVVSSGIARGVNEQIYELVKSISEGAKQVMVHHVANKSMAQMLSQEVAKRFACPVEICELGPVLAIHLGTSVIGVSWIC